jgi:hypothetical protein
MTTFPFNLLQKSATLQQSATFRSNFQPSLFLYKILHFHSNFDIVIQIFIQFFIQILFKKFQTFNVFNFLLP